MSSASVNATDNSKSTSSGGDEMTTRIEILTKDIATFQRVRSRLVSSPDSKISDVVSKLIPRLLRRLHALYKDDAGGDENEALASSHEQAISGICGIITNSLDRMKGNPSTCVTNWMVPVLDCLGELLDFDDTQNASPAEQNESERRDENGGDDRNNRDRNVEVAVENGLAGDNFVTPTDSSGNRSSKDKPPESAAGWALVLLQFGMTRLTQENPPSSLMPTIIKTVDYLHKRVYMREYPTQEEQELYIKTAWILIDAVALASGMKVFFDWDLDSFRGNDLDWFKQEIVHVPDAAIEAAALDGTGVFRIFLDVVLWKDTEQISQFGEDVLEARRLRQKRKSAREWNEQLQNYFCHLKLAFLRYAICPKGRGLFCGDGRNGCRAQILAALTADDQSVYGKLALSFLGNTIQNNSTTQQAKKPRKETKSYSISTACALIYLVLGDDVGGDVIRGSAFENLYSDFCALVGGGPPKNNNFLRTGVSRRHQALTFLVKNPMSNIDEVTEDEVLKLYLSLLDCLSRSLREGENYAVILFTSYFESRSGLGISVSPDIAQEVMRVSTHLFRGTLQKILEGRNTRRMTFRRSNGLKAFTPINPRMTYRRRSGVRDLFSDNKFEPSGFVLQARKAAYGLSVFVFKSWQEPPKTFDFSVPAMLFRSTISDVGATAPHAAKALRSILEVVKMNPESRPEQSQVIQLLPPILEVICSDVSRSHTKLVLEWTKDFIESVDNEAASFIYSYISNAGDLEGNGDALSSRIEHNGGIGKCPGSVGVSFIDTTSQDQTVWLRAALENQVNQAKCIMSVGFGEAAAVLYDFGFSFDSLQESLEEDRTKVLKESGILTRPKEDSRVMIEEEGTGCCCLICYEDTSESAVQKYECGHVFCDACCAEYVSASYKEGYFHLLGLRCPQHGCNKRLCLEDLCRIAPAAGQKWETAFLDSFVGQDARYQRCPGPNCGTISEMTTSFNDNGAVCITCNKCQTKFCAKCGQHPHQPASCEDKKEWDRILGNNSFWVKKNTKPCPGCEAPIEKNSGCNHMTCARCGAEFCWLCIKKLNSYSEDHVCERYDPLSAADDKDQERALFLTDRFTSHEDGAMYAMRQMDEFDAQVNEATEIMDAFDEKEIETFYSALKTLISARHFLKNSYMVAFATKGDERLKEFQSHREALEMFTDRLSYLTEVNVFEVLDTQGESGLRVHFRALFFYTDTVANFMTRVGKHIP